MVFKNTVCVYYWSSFHTLFEPVLFVHVSTGSHTATQNEPAVSQQLAASLAELPLLQMSSRGVQLTLPGTPRWSVLPCQKRRLNPLM